MDEASAATPLLSIDGLSVFYDQFCAVKNVTLNVHAGEIVAIIGANGAGKSSLLKAIVAHVERAEGSIWYEGRDITKLPTSAIVAAGIALVPEGRKLFASLTVEENLMVGWQVGRRVGAALDDVYELFPALQSLRRQRASRLSGGQQQMVALGRALLVGPRLLLCDEISLGLAPKIISDLYGLLVNINQRGIGVVLVEQDIGRALAISNRYYCMLSGRISLTGRPSLTDRDIITKHYFGV